MGWLKGSRGPYSLTNIPLPPVVVPPSKNPYIYIFVRQDISLAQQVIQSNHATWEASQQFNEKLPVSSMILIGVPNEAGLRDIAIHLMADNIRFVPFFEPDNLMGLSAITTEPLTDSRKRESLCHFTLWSV